jgi:hypothetical protein
MRLFVSLPSPKPTALLPVFYGTEKQQNPEHPWFASVMGRQGTGIKGQFHA